MTTPQQQYGVGIVGLDHWYAGIGAADDLQRSPRAKLLAMAHRDEGKLKEFAAERGIPTATTDYRAIAQVPGVDLVVTACTTAENTEICIDAARRGKHIVSVKPFAMNLAEADRLIGVVKETGVLFASFDASHRLSGQWQQYKQWIAEGRIGKPVSITVIQRATLDGASMDWPGRRNDKTWWRDPAKVPGGGWIDHAIYQVDALRWLLDDEIARVSGVAKTVSHPELPKELEDFGVALIEFKKGAVATVEVTWTGVQGAGMNLTQIVGTEGQIAFDPTLSGKLGVAGAGFQSPTGSPGWMLVSPGGRRGTGLADHLLECLETGRTPVASIDDSRAALKACLGFYEAARSGRAVIV